MPILDKLRNIFTSNSSNAGDGKKKAKFPLIKQDADPNELWAIVGELGDGAFGKVYKAQHKEKHELAALKQVDINNENELEDYSVEIDILNLCRHKNVVGLYESYLFGDKLWMFIEFCELGALDSIMLELEKPLTEHQIRYICREMCEGLDFLHQSCIIHRDLKAGNVLLTHDGGVKLADFGVSAKNTSVKQKRDSYIGTPYWMAPEVILCETIKDSPYDFKADIWSFGITLIEFAQIEPPNHEMHPMRVVLKIQKSDPPTLRAPHKWSREFNDFIAKCLVKDPEKRLTAGELFNHPFIRDVRGSEGISDLLSELRAEITLEEKDIEEEMDNTADTDTGTESDASSLSKVATEDSISNTESVQPPVKVAEDDSSPAVVEAGGKAGVITSEVVAGDANVKVLVPVDGDKSSLVKPPTDDIRNSKEFEGVVFREKKPKQPVVKVDEPMPPSREESEDKSPSPEPKASAAELKKKKYRSLTKTRKFMVNGEVVTSKVQKFISHDGDEKQREHKLWKADLRELKMLHRMENRQLQDLEIRSLQATEEQSRKFEQDELAMRSMYETRIDMLSKQHKQQIDKLNSTHANEKKSLMKKLKCEQERDTKSFLEGLKQELKYMKQEFDMKSRKEAYNKRKLEKEAEHLARQSKFVEEQKKQVEKAMNNLDDQQADQFALAEKQYLQQKQQIVRAREVALWDMEERHMTEKHQLAEQLLKNKFVLKRSLMMQRHSKETDQVKRINTCKEDELLACHAFELKRLPKILKSDAKTRALMYRESIRISVINITLDEEKEKVKKFEEMEKKRAKEERARLEAKHKRQLDEMRSKNKYLIKELEQVHADKENMLLENEMLKTAELTNQYRQELADWKDELQPRKKRLDELFTSQLEEQEKLLNLRDYSAAMTVAASTGLTPMMKTKQSRSFFGKLTDSQGQNEESSNGLTKSNSQRSSKRSSAFGNFTDRFRDSTRSSIPPSKSSNNQPVVTEGVVYDDGQQQQSRRQSEESQASVVIAVEPESQKQKLKEQQVDVKSVLPEESRIKEDVAEVDLLVKKENEEESNKIDESSVSLQNVNEKVPTIGGCQIEIEVTKPDETSEEQKDSVPEVAVPGSVLDQVENVAVPGSIFDQAEEVVGPESVLHQVEEVAKPEGILDQAENVVEPGSILDQAENVVEPGSILDQAKEVAIPEDILYQAEKVAKTEDILYQAEKVPKPEDILEQVEKVAKPKDILEQIDLKLTDNQKEVCIDDVVADHEDLTSTEVDKLKSIEHDKLEGASDTSAEVVEKVTKSVVGQEVEKPVKVSGLSLEDCVVESKSSEASSDKDNSDEESGLAYEDSDITFEADKPNDVSATTALSDQNVCSTSGTGDQPPVFVPGTDKALISNVSNTSLELSLKEDNQTSNAMQNDQVAGLSCDKSVESLDLNKENSVSLVLLDPTTTASSGKVERDCHSSEMDNSSIVSRSIETNSKDVFEIDIKEVIQRHEADHINRATESETTAASRSDHSGLTLENLIKTETDLIHSTMPLSTDTTPSEAKTGDSAVDMSPKSPVSTAFSEPESLSPDCAEPKEESCGNFKDSSQEIIHSPVDETRLGEIISNLSPKQDTENTADEAVVESDSSFCQEAVNNAHQNKVNDFLSTVEKIVEEDFSPVIALESADTKDCCNKICSDETTACEQAGFHLELLNDALKDQNHSLPCEDIKEESHSSVPTVVSQAEKDSNNEDAHHREGKVVIEMHVEEVNNESAA